MDAAINRFICLLKKAGIGISPAESIDAVRALAWLGLADRETTRGVLRATLIKDVHNQAVFEELFDLFFTPPAAATLVSSVGEAGAPAAISAPNAERVVLDTEDDGFALGTSTDPSLDTLKIQPGSLDELVRNLLIKRADTLLDQVMERASHQVNVRTAQAGARPGELNFAESTPTLDADLILAALQQVLEDASDLDVDATVVETLREKAAAVLDRLPEALKRALMQQLSLQPEAEEAGAAPPPSPPQRFSEGERREMEEIVRRLGRRLRGARSYRRVIGHRGRIQVAPTLRASMRYDGIPFRPVLAKHYNERPRLVVICDISLSVRTTARFTLHLVYSLQALFEQVRSFVFVSDLADASQYFEQLSIDEAIAAVLGGRLVDCEANSNYGRAFEIFTQHHLAAVTGQTTVLVLGDGRGNRHPPNVAALEEIRRRAKQLIWLSPESRGSWRLGSSDMRLYEPVCHRTEVVRNLTQLGEVADRLLRGHRIGAFDD